MMKIVICGNQSRYQFFRELVSGHHAEMNVSTEFLQQRQVIMENSATCKPIETEDNDETLYIRSLLVPLYTRLIFPREGTMLQGYSDCRILFFDDFPYRKESRIRDLQQGIRTNPYADWEIVLCSDTTNGMSTDVSTMEDALEQARSSYCKEHCIVSEYTKGNGSLLLLWKTEDLRAKLKRDLLTKINGTKMYVEQDFEIDCLGDDSLTEELSPQILKKFVIYDKSMNRVNVWNIYRERAEKYFFHGSGREFLTEKSSFVIPYLRKYGIWSEEQIKKDVEGKIHEGFIQYMRHKDAIFPGNSEIEYEEFRNKTKISTLFSKKIKTFWMDNLKGILVSYIQWNMEKLERILYEE